MVVEFDRRIGVIRRSFKRWGFQFGVQRIVLDLFRIKDVCHNSQLRDIGRRSRNAALQSMGVAGQNVLPGATLQFLRHLL